MFEEHFYLGRGDPTQIPQHLNIGTYFAEFTKIALLRAATHMSMPHHIELQRLLLDFAHECQIVYK